MIKCIPNRFFENQPNGIYSGSNLSKKASCLSPRSSNITVTKEKEKRKRKSEEKERRRRKKSNGYPLSFYNGYFGVVFGRKNCWTQKVSFGGNDFLNIYKIYIAPTLT